MLGGATQFLLSRGGRSRITQSDGDALNRPLLRVDPIALTLHSGRSPVVEPRSICVGVDLLHRVILINGAQNICGLAHLVATIKRRERLTG